MYGRHPPPGYREWYQFARERGVHDIDDFDQINDDLRPFWAITPNVIRKMTARMAVDPDAKINTVSIRNGCVNHTHADWRVDTFTKMLMGFASRLPDMDIPINVLDQPRIIVPFEEIQQLLATEQRLRSMEADLIDTFTSNQHVPQHAVEGFSKRSGNGKTPRNASAQLTECSPAWINWASRPYMDFCAAACPPDSYARNKNSTTHLLHAETLYKDPNTKLVTNFNLSTDLCSVGIQLADLHGLLYASTSMLLTTKLVPIFSESKTNVNNDILYPANMYYRQDPRYDYNDQDDLPWANKQDLMVWRGATSGGATHANEHDRWRHMHRQRLVLMTNSTELEDTQKSILALSSPEDSTGDYALQDFAPAIFARKHADTGFTDMIACVPNCDFYNQSLRRLPRASFPETFRSKYLIDVDGMSFSGRWRAFLLSGSLPMKATIFREWHDSRLWPWKHFVPVDNRYDDLYTLLTYFIGIEQRDESNKRVIKVPTHDREAFEIARAGREHASKVLRREDMEIYLYRLLLEYGRIIDDNRDKIGFSRDRDVGMMVFDKMHPAAA